MPAKRKNWVQQLKSFRVNDNPKLVMLEIYVGFATGTPQRNMISCGDLFQKLKFQKGAIHFTIQQFVCFNCLVYEPFHLHFTNAVVTFMYEKLTCQGKFRHCKIFIGLQIKFLDKSQVYIPISCAFFIVRWTLLVFSILCVFIAKSLKFFHYEVPNMYL